MFFGRIAAVAEKEEARGNIGQICGNVYVCCLFVLMKPIHFQCGDWNNCFMWVIKAPSAASVTNHSEDNPTPEVQRSSLT